MLILAIFHFLFTIYGCVTSWIHFHKAKKIDKAELVDDFTDISLSVLLLLVGLSAEGFIPNHWIIFMIPLLMHIAGKLYLRKLTGYKVNV